MAKWKATLMKIDLSGFNTRLEADVSVKIRPKGLWGWLRFILREISCFAWVLCMIFLILVLRSEIRILGKITRWK